MTLKDEWQMWMDMILSGQMDHGQVIAFLQDHPEFAAWYLEPRR